MNAEEHIKDKIEKILNEGNATGAVLSDENISDLINQDQRNVHEINDLYIKLVNTIKIYKNVDIDIEKTKSEIKIYEKEIQAKHKEIEKIDKEIEVLLGLQGKKLAEKTKIESRQTIMKEEI